MSVLDLGGKWVAKLAALALVNSPLADGDTPLAAFGKLQAQISALSVGGAAAINQATVTLPYSPGLMTTVNVANAAVSPTSKIIVNLVGTNENEEDDIDDWEVKATPLAGSIDFNFSCPGPFAGQVAINYMIG